MFKNLFASLFPKRRTRKALKFVSYLEADALLKEGWSLAKEEDTNRVFGMVYLELLETAEAPKEI